MLGPDRVFRDRLGLDRIERADDPTCARQPASPRLVESRLDAASRVRSGSRHTEAGLVARLRVWRVAARRRKKLKTGAVRNEQFVQYTPPKVWAWNKPSGGQFA